MELFDAIPASLFTVLTSKNRDTYASALLVMRKTFTQDVMVEKEVLISHLTNTLQKDLLDIDVSVEEGYTEESIKDANALARFIVKRFKDTGWIDTEYARGTRLQEFITLPPYSLKLLDLLNSLCSQREADYGLMWTQVMANFLCAWRGMMDGVLGNERYREWIAQNLMSER